MEKEEQLKVQEEWEEEVGEAALLVRKSKPSKNTAINGTADAAVSDHEVSSNGKIGNESDKIHEANENRQQRSEDCVYYDKDEGGNFIYFSQGEAPTNRNPAFEGLNVASHSISVEKIPPSAKNYQYKKHSQDESLSISTPWPSEFSHDDHNASYKSFSNNARESADVAQ